MNSGQTNTGFAGYFPSWCPGCGNFGIWAALKSAFQKLGFNQNNFAIVYGIGCSGNMNDFLWVDSFHALHGRAIPMAIGIKIANHKLPVVVIAGDGDCYGEGGNHLMHAARGNHDITVIVHDNRVYGLTTGQTAPTATKGYKAKSTPAGIIEVPLNPIALAITQGGTFVAQGFSGDIIHLTDLIVAGISHKGFSLVNIFQPCITWNHEATFPWYRERIYKVTKENHDPGSSMKALEKSMELETKLPIGIIYQSDRPSYTGSLPQLESKTLIEGDCGIDIAPFVSEFV